MAHPKTVSIRKGTTWHLEDEGLNRRDALALRAHLRNTEGKRASISKDGKHYKIWWAVK